MKNIVKTKSSYILLITGLALLVSGYLFAFLSVKDSDILAKYLETKREGFSFIQATNPYFIVVIVALLVPIIEEFAFRFWTKGKLLNYIVSAIGISVFLLASQQFQLGYKIAIIALLFYFTFLFKHKHKNLFLAFITSLVFGSLHVSNFCQIEVVDVQNFLITTGLGLIASFIGLNFRFIYCIILHVAFNMFGTFGFILDIDKAQTIENEQETVYVKPLSKYAKEETFFISNDSLFLQGDVRYIVDKLIDKNQIKNVKSNLFFEKFRVWAKSKEREIDKANVLKAFVQSTSFSFDTVYRKYEVMEFADTSKLKATATEGYGMFSKSHVVENINQKFGKNIITNDTLHNVLIFKPSIFSVKKYEELLQLLSEQGIYIKETADSLKILEIGYK